MLLAISYNIMEPLPKLAKNIFSLFSARAIEILCRLVAIAVVTRYLGVEKYGEYVFVNTFVLFFANFVNLGVEEIVTREVAKSTSLAGAYLSGVISLRLLLIPATSFIYLAVTHLLDLSDVVLRAIHISIATQICLSFIALFFSILRGMEKMEYEPLIGLLINLMFIPSVIFISHSDLGFISIFNANLVIHLIAALVAFLCLTRIMTSYNFSFDFRVGLSFLRSGFALGISGLLTMGSFYVSIFVLSYLRGATDIALFQLPYQFILRLFIIPISLVTAFFPTLSRLSGESALRGDPLKTTITQIYKFLIIISSLIILLVMCFSDNIILLLGGKTFLGASISFRILIWIIIFSFTDFLQSMTLVALNKQRLLIVQSLVCVVLGLLLNLLLVPFYGYIGASIATLCAFGVRFIIGFQFVTKTIGHIPIYRIMAKPILAGVFAGAFMLCFSTYNIIFISFVGIILYSVSIIALRGLTLDEIGLLKENMSR